MKMFLQDKQPYQEDVCDASSHESAYQIRQRGLQNASDKIMRGRPHSHIFNILMDQLVLRACINPDILALAIGIVSGENLLSNS